MTAAAMALLAGCGSEEQCFWGCSDGTGAGPGGGGSGTQILIDDEDVTVMALREAWFAATTSAAVPSLVVATGIGDTSGGVAAGPGAKTAMRSMVYVDPFGPTVYNCPVSGTFTVSGDVTDPNTVTEGDFIDYESSACDSGAGFTVDGDHTLDIVSIVGDVNSGQYEQGQTLTFGDWRAATQSLATTLSGDHTSVIDTTSPSSVTMSFTGNSLTVLEEQVTVAISNYTGFAAQQTASPFTNTLNASGRANSTVVQGWFDYFTDETIRQDTGQFPHDGILQIFGRDGGSARVAVSDETGLNVQLDRDGDTNHETTIAMTWEEFFGL